MDRQLLLQVGSFLLLTALSACSQDGGAGGPGGSHGSGDFAGNSGSSSDAGGTAGSGASAQGGSETAGTAGAAAGGLGGMGAGGAGGFAGTGNMPGTGGTAAMTLSEAEVLHAAITANSGEITQGELAVSLAASEDILAHAQTEISHHTISNEMAQTVATELALEPLDNAVSQDLALDWEAEMGEIEATTGPEFELSYMRAQVRGHQAVLALLDEQLIPAASSVALANYLHAVRMDIESHLTSAQDILVQIDE